MILANHSLFRVFQSLLKIYPLKETSSEKAVAKEMPSESISPPSPMFAPKLNVLYFTKFKRIASIAKMAPSPKLK